MVIRNYNFLYFSIAVLSVFSETYHIENKKCRKRQRFPNKNNVTEAEPVNVGCETQTDVS